MTLTEIANYIKPFALNEQGDSFRILYLNEGEDLSDGLCSGDVCTKETTDDNSISECAFDGLALEKAIDLCIHQEFHLNIALIDSIGCFDSLALRAMKDGKYDFSKQRGYVARMLGRDYEVMVLNRYHREDEWYIGTVDEYGADYTTESVEAYSSQEEAAQALENKTWTQIKLKQDRPNSIREMDNADVSLLETYKAIALSTSHLKETDVALLERLANSENENHVASRNTGFFVKLCPFDKDEDDESIKYNYISGASDNLNAIMKFATLSLVEMIEFDSAANECKIFKTYEW